jgi:hypothetical protein
MKVFGGVSIAMDAYSLMVDLGMVERKAGCGVRHFISHDTIR